MRTSIFPRFGDDRGNAATEFALTLPVLVFMALGAMDFGMAYSTQTGYESAVRAGFEYAFSNSSDLTGIAKRVTANIADTGSLDSGYPSAVEECECADGTVKSCTGSNTCSDGTSPNHYVKITVQGSYKVLFDWPFIDSTQPIKYSGRVRVQ